MYSQRIENSYKFRVIRCGKSCAQIVYICNSLIVSLVISFFFLLMVEDRHRFSASRLLASDIYLFIELINKWPLYAHYDNFQCISTYNSQKTGTSNMSRQHY